MEKCINCLTSIRGLLLHYNFLSLGKQPNGFNLPNTQTLNGFIHSVIVKKTFVLEENKGITGTICTPWDAGHFCKGQDGNEMGINLV